MSNCESSDVLPLVREIEKVGLRGTKLTKHCTDYLYKKNCPTSVYWKLNNRHELRDGCFSLDGDTFFLFERHRFRVLSCEGYFFEPKTQGCLYRNGWAVVQASLSSDGHCFAVCDLSPYVQFLFTSDFRIAHSREFAREVLSVVFANTASSVVFVGEREGYLARTHADRPIEEIRLSEEDINAVASVDLSGQVNLFAGDSCSICLFDWRTPSNAPSIHFSGHQDGITSLDVHQDGRTFLSNCKDQSIKVWDLRCPDKGALIAPTHRIPWDYRFEPIPRSYANLWKSAGSLPGDASLATLTGHRVRFTLIRARFSPFATTGGHFIVAGSAEGCVHLWSNADGWAPVAKTIVSSSCMFREVRWHPWRSQLMAVGSNGELAYLGPEGAPEPVVEASAPVYNFRTRNRRKTAQPDRRCGQPVDVHLPAHQDAEWRADLSARCFREGLFYEFRRGHEFSKNFLVQLDDDHSDSASTMEGSSP